LRFAGPIGTVENDAKRHETGPTKKGVVYFGN